MQLLGSEEGASELRGAREVRCPGHPRRVQATSLALAPSVLPVLPVLPAERRRRYCARLCLHRLCALTLLSGLSAHITAHARHHSTHLKHTPHYIPQNTHNKRERRDEGRREERREGREERRKEGRRKERKRGRKYHTMHQTPHHTLNIPHTSHIPLRH